MSATKPIPHASCSKRGSYSPCLCGSHVCIMVQVLLDNSGFNSKNQQGRRLIRRSPDFFDALCMSTGHHAARLVTRIALVDVTFRATRPKHTTNDGRGYG